MADHKLARASLIVTLIGGAIALLNWVHGFPGENAKFCTVELPPCSQ
jgi:hypothetical protein